ncbi:hypothetical protein L9F63_017560, partial [Diploptera punctata]
PLSIVRFKEVPFYVKIQICEYNFLRNQQFKLTQKRENVFNTFLLAVPHPVRHGFSYGPERNVDSECRMFNETWTSNVDIKKHCKVIDTDFKNIRKTYRGTKYIWYDETSLLIVIDAIGLEFAIRNC